MRIPQILETRDDLVEPLKSLTPAKFSRLKGGGCSLLKSWLDIPMLKGGKLPCVPKL